MDTVLYSLSETIHKKNYVVATYHIVLPKETDVMKKAASLAIGQTIGTWIPIPGITEEIREKYMGKVVNIFDVPSLDLYTQVETDTRDYLIQIAYPAVNFSDDLTLLITSLLGNDASTSAQVKLIDIDFPEEYLKQFAGPRYGLEGVQEYTGVKDRPLILNMIKPCTGLTPEQGAKIFYETALGGPDFIKDDELLGDPVYSRPEDRVKHFKKAADAAYEKTGIRTRYLVNITSGVENLVKNAKLAEEAGADGLMINYAAVGFSALKMLANNTKLPILGHSAGSGIYCEGTANGMSTPLAVAKFARIAGADIVMCNTPYGGYPLSPLKYQQTVQQLVLPLYHLKATMPSIGGGVHPGMVEKYMKENGKNIVLAAGGAVQGHPMGAAAGIRALRQAVDIVLSGQDFESAAKSYEELSTAINLWGYRK